MKAILALMILMIGLVVMPPGPVHATSIDHGISYVADVGYVAPAIVVQEIGGVAYQQLSNVIILTHSDAILLGSYLVSDEKIIMKLPVVALFYVDRLFQMTLDSYKRPPNSQICKATTENIKISPIQIRADSQV
jgi:hypothetical protein